MASWTRSGSPTINPLRVREQAAAAWAFASSGDRDRPWSFEEPSSGIGLLRTEVSRMAQDLALAQRHAFALARTLMVPVTLFRSGNEFGVLPSDELDDGEVETIAEFDPFEYGPAH